MLLTFRQRQALELLFLLIWSFSYPAHAGTYAVIPYTFSWIDAGSHSKLGPTTGGLYSATYKFTGNSGCGSSVPILDDIISDDIPLGFSFRFGATDFTSLRVMSNGRIQFNNNTTCGFGSPVTQLPYPNAGLNYSMRIYGNDLDPTLKSEVSGYSTSCISRASCYVSYATAGSAPDRQFVVTWYHVPEWTSTNSASGAYDLQLILQENGEFIYQFGSSVRGPAAALAQIGWQISTSDYAVSSVGFPTDNSAFKFYIPGSSTTVPGKFNAFDSTTAAADNTGYIKTKIAGSSFTLDVVATNSTGATRTTGFTGGVAIELVDASSGSCSTYPTIGNAAIVNFTSADAGRKTVAFSESNVWQNVRIRIKYPFFSPSVIACSTDNFAIRPYELMAVASDSNWTSAGTSRTLNAATASATPTHKAGQPFTITATAKNAVGAVTSRYNGTPSAGTVNCVLPATGCVMGTFSAGGFSNNAGVATSTTASYSEVGAISSSVSDANFAAVDAADGSTLAERTVSSAIFTIGRFVPDYFDVTLNTPVFSPGCGNFTYIGQPIKYATQPVAEVTAKNAAAVISVNYTGSLWKISPSNLSYGITPSYAEASQSLTVLNNSVPIATDNGNGTGSLSFADTTSNILAIARGNPLAPLNAEIALSFNLQDTDAVQVARINGVAGNNPVKFGAASAGNGIAFSGGNKTQRWGRLTLSNAHGSELTALLMPLFSEYFNGTAFVTNTADNCTSLSSSTQLKLGNSNTSGGALQAGTTAMTIGSGTSTAILANTPLLAGNGGLSFSAPGAGNTGYIDVSADLSSLPWLLFDWDHDGGHDDAPTAKATFGIYKGNSRQIYLREVY